MNKPFLILFSTVILLFCFSNSSLFAQSADLRIQYKTGTTGATSQTIDPYTRLYNDGGSGVTLTEVKIRYWFTSEPPGQDVYVNYWSAIGAGNITSSFGTIAGVRYLEIGFTSGAGTLAGGANTGEMQNRIHDDGWANYTQTNDYSFDASRTSYADYDKITVYHNGSLVWGTPPPGTSQPENMEVTVEPTTTTAGSLISPAPTVYLEDAIGDPVAGVEVTVSVNQNSFAGGSTLTVETDEDGLAVFDNLKINDATTGYQLIFDADAPLVSNENSTTFTVEADDPDEMVITAQPGNTVAGSTISLAPAVTLTDAFGNPTPGIDVSISLNKNSLSSGTATVATNASGVATFSDLVITQASTGYIITFDADATSIDNENSSTFNITAAPAANMTVSTQPIESVADGVIAGPPAVLVTDTYGNPKSGVNVTVSETDGYVFDVGTLTKSTNASGIATFNDLEIHTVDTGYQLTFDADAVGVSDVNSNLFDVVGAGGTMTVTVNPSNTVAGVNLTPAPKITLLDDFDVPIAGVDVTVSLNQGSFASGTLTRTTNASGVATFSNLKINSADTDYVIMFNADMSGVANVFSNEFDIIAATASSMSITTTPSATVAGNSISGPPAVTIVDAFGNPVSGIDITVSLNKNSFASGTTTVSSNSSGIASYSNLVITTAATAYQLTFNADAAGVSNQTSGNFNVTAATASTLELIVEPTNSTASVIMSPAPVVLIEDTYGNPKSGVNVTASLNKNSFMAGSTTIVSTNSSGQAVFNNLKITTVATNYELTFSAPSLSSDTSIPFNIIQPNPTFGSIRLQYDNDETNATTNGIEPIIRFYNESGWPLNLSDLTVRYWYTSKPINDPGASGTDIFEVYWIEMDGDESGILGNFDEILSQQYLEIGFSPDMILPIGLGGDGSTPDLMPDDATSGGIAFRIRDDGWGTYDQSNDYSYDPTITTYTDYDKITVYYKGQLIAGTPPSGTTEAENMDITVQPTASTAGSLISPAPTVYLEDALGDPVAGIEVTVSVNKNSFAGGSTLIVETDVDGLAVFDNLTLNTAATGYQFTFNADATLVSNKNSSTFTVSASTPDEMVVTAQPVNTAAGSTVSPAPAVTITDAFGNPTPGIDVTISLNKNSLSSGTTTVATNASGVATFSNLVITQASTGYIITFDADAAGIDNENSSAFNITAAAALNMTVSTQPTESVAGGVIAGPPAVLVTDTHGNPKSGVNVTVSETGGYTFDAGTLTRSTNASGIATFNDLEIHTVDTDYQLTFDADAAAVSDENSNLFDVVGAGGTMTVTAHPTTTVAGVNLSPAPSITLLDDFDDPVADVDVTVSLNQGDFASGTLTVTTNASGVATFSNLKINSADTDYIITFNADMAGVANVFSDEFVIIAADAASMSITTAPGATVAGNSLAGPPAVTIVDAFGNPVIGIDITVSLNKNSFASGTTTVSSNSSGIASFNNLVITTAATAYQLTFNADAAGVSNQTSGNFNVSAAAASTLELTVEPNNSTAEVTISPAPVVVIEDTYGNPKSGVNVTASLNKNSFMAGSTTIVSTNSSGQAVFNNLRISVADTDYEMTFSAPSLSSDTSDPFEIIQPNPEFGSIRLQYDNNETNVTSSTIQPYIKVINDSDLDINISDLTVRYWFTSEPAGTDVHDTEWLQMGGDDSNVSGTFETNEEDDYYLELSFSPDIVIPIGLGGDGSTPNLMPSGASTGTIQHRIYSSPSGNYDQSDDYSFDSTITTFTDYPYINVYYKGQLVWGIAPVYPQTFYSRQDGNWDSATSWSNESHIGSTSTLFPNTYDTVIIGSHHNITLTENVVNDESVTISSTGTFVTGTHILSGTGNFELESGATLRIGSPDGISASGSTGNIQTDGRIFSTGANYTYNGSAQQITGSGLPQTINNLIINNNNGLIEDSDLVVNGLLKLDNGIFQMPAGASLVTNEIDDSGSGNVRMQLNIDGEFGYRMISSPVETTFSDLFDNFITQGISGSDFPSRQPNILWFMETYADDSETENSSWRTISSLGSTVPGGRGYFFYVFGEIDGDPDYTEPLPRTMNTTGIEYGFDGAGDTFEFDVSYTTPSLESATHTLGWNLIGNPTTATLDWSHEDWERSNIDQTFYVWDPSANSGEGDYLVWNGMTGNNPNEDLIAPFQSFWVKANNSNPSMTISHDVKTTNGEYIGNQSKEISTDDFKELVINLTGNGLNGNLFITFTTDGKMGIDPLDAYSLEPLNQDTKLLFYTSIRDDDNPPLVINTLQVGGFRDNNAISDNFNLSWNLPGDWPSDWAVVLMDHEEKTAIPLHSQTDYNFWYDTPESYVSKNSVTSDSASTEKYILPENIVNAESVVSPEENSIRMKTTTPNSRFTIFIEKGVDPNIVEYLPEVARLKHNYPNPFNSSTTILFDIPVQDHVKLSIYDMLGRNVGTLINETLQPGTHRAIWNPGNLASGVYYSRLEFNSVVLTNKMILVK